MDPELLVLDGLLRADRALASVPGVQVQYDDLITCEDTLVDALSQLYPACRPAHVHYITAGFQRKRARQIALHNSEEFHRIEAKRGRTVPGRSPQSSGPRHVGSDWPA